MKKLLHVLSCNYEKHIRLYVKVAGRLKVALRLFYRRRNRTRIWTKLYTIHQLARFHLLFRMIPVKVAMRSRLFPNPIAAHAAKTGIDNAAAPRAAIQVLIQYSGTIGTEGCICIHIGIAVGADFK